MQLYLALSAMLASGGQQPLAALQEAEAELASLAPDAAKTKVGFSSLPIWRPALGCNPELTCWPYTAVPFEQEATAVSLLPCPKRSPSI